MIPPQNPVRAGNPGLPVPLPRHLNGWRGFSRGVMG